MSVLELVPKSWLFFLDLSSFPSSEAGFSLTFFETAKGIQQSVFYKNVFILDLLFVDLNYDDIENRLKLHLKSHVLVNVADFQLRLIFPPTGHIFGGSLLFVLK